ncbi:pickpocket protein 28 [Drosophila mojavensis]|uniref:Pickpocket protein 28 n=3 Tax=Drosophila mojavensis TaxID=7230 RepID=A0A0Q9WPD7_DROMO|nr:pickpocket protein 28 [Drosophila mojavensis]KRF94123.1 LOW QUALITY PROTEIN: uncharacterized protein Dmoj_GI14761 [Drosophila mojavensis]
MFVRTKGFETKSPATLFECDMEGNDFDVNTRNKTKKTPKRAAGRTICQCFMLTYKDYFQHSSLHGVQYLGEETRPKKDRIFWLFAFLLSICCCATLILSAYNKWNETPVIVSFAERSTPVWNIPFPAVTICSETKRVLQSQSNNTFANLYSQYTAERHNSHVFQPPNVTSKELEEFRTMLHVCNTHSIQQDMPLIPGDNLDYPKVLERMLPPFDRYFFYCRWLSRFNECDKYFRPTLTEEGICYTFNGLRPTDIYRKGTYQYHQSAENVSKSKWSLDKGYDASCDVETYPARVLSAGARSGIFMTLQSFEQEVDYACRGPVQGFKVLLHAPDDVPQVSKQFVRIPMGREVLIAVKPNMITMSEGIAEYDPQRRQCFLGHERPLRFFKVYSESNCELECLANFTLAKCGCVKFSMPRSLDMPVCSENKIHCYHMAERELLVREFHRVRKLNAKGASSDGRPMETACNCMPACTSLVYNAETSQANFDLHEMLAAEGDTDFLRDYPGSQMSRLSIYFKQNQFITSKRSELYGVTDFLANCGGIFGLFMGFSILSLVEVVYYFTLRFGVNLKQMYKVDSKATAECKI